MARKPAISYDNVALTPQPASAAPPAMTAPQDAPTQKGRGVDKLSLYIHPDGHLALKRYALEQRTKVNSLVVEALEEWFSRHGLRQPVRPTTGENS